MSDHYAFLLGFTGGFFHYVHVAGADGTGPRRLTPQRAIGRPDFAPEATHVVFPGPVTDDSDGRYGLYVVEIDGGALRRLTAPLLADLDPSWSPDGTRIAFVRQVGNTMDPNATRLYSMPAGGGAQSQVTATLGARDPAWSPDSQRLAFTAGGNLYLVAAGGGTAGVLATGGARYPAWSPDGRSIAYVQPTTRERSRLMVVSPSGGAPTARADHGMQVEDPRWASDSKSIVYVVYRGQGYDGRTAASLYRATPGSSPTRVATYSSPVIRLAHYSEPPPGIIEELLSEVTQRTVELSWVNPSDVDLARVEVRMVPGAVPVTSPSAGTLVYSGRFPTALITSGIAPSTTYSFTVFAVDTSGGYSPPVSTTVTTPAPRAPDAPAHVEAVPGNRSARVSWVAPLNDGGRVITGWTVQVGSRPALAVPAALSSVVVESLTAHQAHAVSVVAHNELGTSPAGATTVTPDAGAVAGTYTALSPSRLLDTRGGSGPLSASVDEVVTVAGSAGVPSDGAAAVAMGVTVVRPSTSGHLKVYPASATEPGVSTLNFRVGQTVANHDVVPLGNDAVALALSSGTAHVVMDVAGFYATAAGPAGGRLNALTPQRLVDTRVTSTPIAPGGALTVQVTGMGGVPATGVASAVLIVTAVRPSAPTYLSVYPAGSSRPSTSVSNPAAGDTTAVLVTAKLSPDGRVSIFNASGVTNVVVDVLGYHTATAAQPGELYVPVAPARVMDTRLGLGVRPGRIGADGRVTLSVHGAGGVPSSARTALLNLTATQATTDTYLTVWPSDRRPAPSSVLNVPVGRTVANLVLAKLSPSGAVTFRNANGAAHLIADVRGYFTPVLP